MSDPIWYGEKGWGEKGHDQHSDHNLDCAECGGKIAMTDVEGHYVGSCKKCRTHVTTHKENGEEITTHG